MILASSPRIRRALVLFLCFVGAIANVAAHEDDEPESVVISTHRIEETLPDVLSRFGNRVTTLTNDELRKGVALDVSEALQAATPGLFIQNKNGPFDYADISLLGSRTQDVLFLIDGVRVNNRLYAGTTPTDTLPAGMIDHIDVLEGGQALFYGTQAVAGVVNIITRPFSDELKATANVGADTHWGRHFDGFASNGWGPNQLVAYVSLDQSRGFRAFRAADYQPSNTDRDRGYGVYTVGGKYAFDVTERLRLSATYNHTRADLDFASPYRVARDNNSRTENLGTFKIDFALNDTTGFYIKSYYHRWHTYYDTYYNDLIEPGTLDFLYRNAFWGYDDYGINAMGTRSVSDGIEYSLGYDLQVYGGEDQVLRIEPAKEHTHAVFGQIRATPEFLPRTHLAAGFRYNAPDVGLSATLWNLSAQIDLSRELYVRTTLGTNFRLPTAEELFADDPQDERGNPRLRPERSRSINLSIGGTAAVSDSGFTWEVVGFARNIGDLIDYGAFDAATGQSIFENVPGTVKVRGGEIDLGLYWSDWMTVRGSLAANQSKQDGAIQLARIPTRVAKANFDYHPSNLPFGVTFAVTYTGAVGVDVGGDRVGYGNYAVADASSYFMFGKARRQRVTIGVQNLFNRQYGRPSRGCQDVSTDGPNNCSAPYTYVNRGMPLTAAVRYSYQLE